MTLRHLLLIVALLLIVGCRRETAVDQTLTTAPTPTAGVTPSPEATNRDARGETFDFITIATDAPNPPFADFNLLSVDEFGQLVGFDAEVMADIAAYHDWEYEFIVTSYDGMLESVANGEFDAAMSALLVESPPSIEGIAYTAPYLEVGQVLVVRANDRERQSYRDLTPETPIGVQSGAVGEAVARDTIGITDTALQTFRTTPEALQALIDGAVDGVIIDHDDAERYTNTYWQQLKIAGGDGRDAWITSRAYAIAVAETDQTLLTMLNEAIAATTDETQAVRNTWLVAQSAIDAGESLIGTPADQIVVGAVHQPISLDPAGTTPDLLNWELMINTLSGLLTFDTENDLRPLLAEAMPVVSEDRLTYTFTLRDGLAFPNGRSLTADDVKWSIDRAASNGISVVNGILKDENGDGFADDDAVVVLNGRQVRFVLQEPASFFLHLLATPPYFVINQDCYLNEADPTRACAGLGPYTIEDWLPGEKIDLAANPVWPGERPAFQNIQLRLYPDTASMRGSLENSAIDIAWTGLTEADLSELRADPDFSYWAGPVSFKSYLIFEQSEPPWDNPRLREAAAYAIDREALADIFDGQRSPLFSPVPDTSPGHLSTEPRRDLDRARDLLAQVGYSESNPLPVELWYISDGRYSSREETYANAIKAQLDETGVFQVTLQNAPWDTYRPQMSSCQYPAFLLGWPSPGQPPRSADPTGWINYFVTNTSNICSNYASEEMDALMAAAMAVDPLDRAAFDAAFNQVQLLWAEEFPALDLTQAPRIAVSLSNVNDVAAAIDAMGLMHYGSLSKGGE